MLTKRWLSSHHIVKSCQNCKAASSHWVQKDFSLLLLLSEKLLKILKEILKCWGQFESKSCQKDGNLLHSDLITITVQHFVELLHPFIIASVNFHLLNSFS